MIKAKQLRVVAGAYLSGMGYYVEILPEIPNTDLKPDVIGIRPRLKDVKLRLEKGGAPAGSKLFCGIARRIVGSKAKWNQMAKSPGRSMVTAYRLKNVS